MPVKKFQITIHYTEGKEIKEIVLKDIEEQNLNGRWQNIFQAGVKIQTAPYTWEVISPFRINEVLIHEIRLEP